MESIIIDENYRIEADQLNWTLIYEVEKEAIDKKTKLPKMVMSKKQTYHATIKHALKSYCDESLRPNKSVTELIAAINQLELKIDNLNLN